MRTFDLNINLNLDCFPYLITWFTNLDTREPQGMLDYVTPILNRMLDETLILKHCHLLAISTFENPESYAGNHSWVFQITNPDEIEDNDSLKEHITQDLKKIFPFDPEASMIAPNIFFDGNYFTVIVPYTC